MELYVHLPFCRRKCRYCDFASFPGLDARMEPYVDALLREADFFAGDASEPIDTVYFGGGTPSLLPPSLLSRLISGLKSRLPMEQVREWTAEANPGTLTDPWLEAARRSGVNRLSLGMQAAQAPLLETLGRIHRMDQVRESVGMARAAGFRNLNLDLMFGLPEQSMADWRETVEEALALSPEHISAYGLIPEEGTPLFRDLEAGRLTLPQAETERDMYNLLLLTLKNRGYAQYEISNFARPGFACRHNIGYWRQVPYLGLGLSAASMVRIRTGPEGTRYTRRTNGTDMDAYLAGIAQNAPNLSEQSEIGPAEARFETMMLGLRMNEGVRDNFFEAMHRRSLESCYGVRLRALEARGLVTYVNQPGAWRLTRLGMDLQNQVLVDLMDE
ncbi:MAG: radical SAM family heme chaperone HemW [Clostridia bacterium]|nr:radical SAM family heme chaperone HemW [Clostridia bacterium]